MWKISPYLGEETQLLGLYDRADLHSMLSISMQFSDQVED